MIAEIQNARDLKNKYNCWHIQELKKKKKRKKEKEN